MIREIQGKGSREQNYQGWIVDKCCMLVRIVSDAVGI
jgi:hypothetical protein